MQDHIPTQVTLRLYLIRLCGGDININIIIRLTYPR